MKINPCCEVPYHQSNFSHISILSAVRWPLGNFIINGHRLHAHFILQTYKYVLFSYCLFICILYLLNLMRLIRFNTGICSSSKIFIIRSQTMDSYVW